MATSTATTTTFSSTGSIQTETITISGTYDIVVDGAEGGSAFGNAGGLGSSVSGDVFLQAGAQLEIIVGGVGGAGGTALGGGGGGGGSFVIETNTGSSPVDINELIAGGGGGAGKSSGGASSSVTGSGVAALGGSDSNTGGGGGGGGGFTGGAGGFDFGSFFETPAANGSVSGQSFSGGAGGGGGGKGGFGGGGGGGGGTKGIGGGGGGGGYGGGSGGGSTYGGGGGGGSYVNPNVTNVSETPGVNASAGLVSISLVACFCAGTRIKTARGECAIEDLAIGDRLLTHDGRLRSLRWIGRRSYAGPMLQANSQLWPILIRAGALADAVPARDLRMSATHAVYFNAMLIPAGNLVNGATILREQPANQVDYFNLELDSHDVILAEGAPAESYINLDNRNMFQNAAEYVAPTTLHLPAVECAPRIEFGDELRVLRTRLGARARALGFVVAESHRVALTTRGVTKAKIPPGVSAVHLRSTTDRVYGDHRSLGALIAGLQLDGQTIDLRDPCLSSGFHAIEPHGAGFMRWTNGEAVITLAPTAFEQIIEIDVATLRGSQRAA